MRHVPKNRADFLQKFGHVDLLLGTGNDAAPMTYRGEAPHLQRRSKVEKGSALAATQRFVTVRARDWPNSKERHIRTEAKMSLGCGAG